MSKYLNADKAEVVEIFIKNNESIIATQREYKRIKKVKKAPDPHQIYKWIQLFREGNLSDQREHNPGRPRSAITDVKKQEVLNLVNKNPHISIRRGGLKICSSPSSFWRILKELNLHPYKIQILQKIPHSSIPKRLEFANVMLKKLENEINLNRIWCTDEAHFYVSGEVNRQNYRYWGLVNPHIIQESALHPQKVTVWVGICSGSLIGPYFLLKKFHRTASLRKMGTGSCKMI